MREIKFRIWDDKYNRYLDINENMYILGALVDGELIVGVDEEKDPRSLKHTFEQYTGLKDKNGVEIYEGDIVKCTRTTVVTDFKECEVVYSKYYAGFALKVPEDNGDFIYIEIHKYINEYLEVIGNIHDKEE